MIDHSAEQADVRALNMALSKSLSGVAEKLSATQVEVHATREGVVATLEAMGKMQKEAEKLRVERTRQSLVTWLKYTDPTTSHQAAQKKRQPGTGEWLLESIRFREWKRTRGSFMWLNGIRESLS
jgi:hypothetical protein